MRKVRRVADPILDVDAHIVEVLLSYVIEAGTRIKQLNPLPDLMKRRHRRKLVNLGRAHPTTSRQKTRWCETLSHDEFTGGFTHVQEATALTVDGTSLDKRCSW